MHPSRAFGCLLACLALAPSARAQQAHPVADGAPSGYELALSGATRAERGSALRLFGTAYEVVGLADLRPRDGLTVEATITARIGSGSDRRVVTQASALTAGGGRFEVAIDVPSEPLSAPMVELVVHRGPQPGRRFTFGLSPLLGEELELLTDRNRYEPGERVRAWARVRDARSLAPRSGRAVRLTLSRNGERLATRDVTSGASGAVTAELVIPATAEAGGYEVRAEVLDPPGAQASRSVQVWRRTVERILAEVELRAADRDGVALVAPSGPLRGRVWARTPSGTPIRGARVELRVRHDAEPVTLVTGDDGAAPFDVRAPAFLSGDVGRETLTARVVHPAYGTITASAGYLMARVRAVVDATARGGALVPEVESTVYLSVGDPRGRPLRAGTEVVVRAEGVAPSTQRAVDDRGYVEVPIRLPRGAASTLRTGPCAGRVATTLEVEVRTDPPAFSRVCVPVSAEALVLPRVTSAPILAPGDGIDVEIARRPAAASRAVLVEALWSGRAVAFAWAAPRESRVRLALPRDLLGVVTVRARAASAPDAREPSTEPGANAFSVGAFDVVLVRPSDAFALAVAPGRERYLVRERAQVELSASRAPSERGWAALLVRDEAAHGGEGPWDLFFLRGELHEAAWQPAGESNARMLRAALSSGLGIDPEPPAPPPLEPPYWEPHRYRPPYHPGMQASRGVLRDPVALREELLRRGLAPVERVLEQVVSELGPEPAARAAIVQGRGFHPGVIAHLVATRRLGDAAARTLGGEPLTVAMIESGDPGFSFDTVARRVARARLARLLLALARLTDPDNPQAQRVSAPLPPDRWLGALVQLSMVPSRDLVDPWGHPFVLREVRGRRARVAVSERALEWELASPGPDGRVGTGDDVVDPFARAVPEGTPYAVTSGEEELLRRFGTLAPAHLVLTRMSQAYARLSLAATEERQAGPVTATGSETADELVAEDLEEDFDGAEGGGGRGGLAMQRSLAREMPARQAPASPAPPPAEPMAAAEAERQERADAPADSRTAALGALVREDFPATLFFAGEVALNERGEATVEVPLADALTTYRLEAIAWTSTGWTTSAASRLRVDQRALIDAPVPPYATAGDVLRLPVRVENRMEEPLPVRIEVRAEGELAIDTPAPVELEVPGREAREAVVVIPLRAAGEGALVVSVSSRGEGLDAVRRPLRVLADARTARERRLELVDSSRALTITVLREASARGPGQLTLAVGARLFGEPAESGDTLWAGWALAVAGEPLSDEIAEAVMQWVSYEDEDGDYLREPLPSALALAAAWADPRLTDADAARALRAVGQRLPSPEALRDHPDAIGDAQADWLLLALSPITGQLDRRAALRADAERLVTRLARVVSTTSARATDAPSTWARAAAALAASGRDPARATEMLRRLERHVVRVGPLAWVEPEEASIYRDDGDPRAQPTALASIALSALGRRSDALAFVRSLLDMRRPPADSEAPILPRPDFAGLDVALASAAAARLGGAAPREVRATLDGRALEVTREGAVWVAALEALGAPGEHALEVRLPEGTVALARVTLAYGMPWDAPPPRAAPIELTVDGEIGARDTRSGALLRVQNRGARILTRPVVELELPAGSELDEPTRDALASHLRAPARQDGRTLVLPLRAMAPGAWLRLPLPLRWAVGGTLRGLGAVAYDDVDPFDAPALPTAVLPSRALEIPDEGPEPERPEAERSEPLPRPPPIPILERLTPGGAR